MKLGDGGGATCMCEKGCVHTAAGIPWEKARILTMQLAPDRM